MAKERAKWMAQSQEEQANLDHQRNQQRLERTEYCAQHNEANCDIQDYNDYNQDRGQQTDQFRQDQRDEGYPQTKRDPANRVRSSPSRLSGGQIKRAQFNPEDELGGELSELPLGNSAQSLAC